MYIEITGHDKKNVILKYGDKIIVCKRGDKITPEVHLRFVSGIDEELILQHGACAHLELEVEPQIVWNFPDSLVIT
jgi:hypothetical protein